MRLLSFLRKEAGKSAEETQSASMTRRFPGIPRRRNFAASLTNNLNNSWGTASISADQLIYNNLQQLRARARDQAYNNDYAKRFIGMVKTNVVGPNGIIVQSKAIGRSGDSDQPAQKAIELAFKSWAKKGICDVKGQLSWKELQRVAISTAAGDGEVLIRVHSSGPNGFQLETIDPVLLDVTYCDHFKGNGNPIRFGIEYDQSTGKVAAYHVSQPGKTAYNYVSSYNSKYYERIPADQMYHLFLPEFINQPRGLPWVSTSLQRLKMLNGYEEASLTAARAGAAKMGHYTSDSGDEYSGDGIDSDGVMFEEFESGTIGVLPKGMKFEGFDPDYPKGEFGPFVKQCLRGISSGLGVSYNTLANDLEGVNYSSMRHGAIEEREVWKCLQDWFIENFVQPVFEEWLARQHTLGTITIPAANGPPRPLSRAIENYMPTEFQGRRWGWVDPLKDIQARREEIALGITSRSAVMRELGRDPEEVWRTIRQETELAAALGISFEPMDKEPEEIEGQPDE